MYKSKCFNTRKKRIKVLPQVSVKTTTFFSEQDHNIILFMLSFPSLLFFLQTLPRFGLTLPPSSSNLIQILYIIFLILFLLPTTQRNMGRLFLLVSRFCSPKEQPCISNTSREGFLKVNPVFPMAKNGECSQDSAIKSNYLRWEDNLFTCSPSWPGLVWHRRVYQLILSHP